MIGNGFHSLVFLVRFFSCEIFREGPETFQLARIRLKKYGLRPEKKVGEGLLRG